ncbi:hypothetical protein M0R01_00660 [bacterium]|nr:hypothetical protein [bacterium]
MQETATQIYSILAGLEQYSPYFFAVFYFLGHVWWFFLPFLFFPNYRGKYLDYMITKFVISKPNVVLEIKLPREVTKPVRAMENVMNTLFSIYDAPGDWKEKYFEGKIVLRMSFEIVGIDGVPHFYVRCPRAARKIVESAFFSQYPEVEIFEVPDYADAVPHDIPNDDWDLWGCEFKAMAKSDVYPIKTYESFFEENIDTKEEKRFDPISTLLENMTLLERGEQLWIQIIAKPVASVDAEDNYFKRGREEIDRLLGRKAEKKADIYDDLPMIIRIWVLIAKILFPSFYTGDEDQKKQEDEFPLEFRLTQGEREVISAIERKISKTCFHSTVRFLYVARREKFSGAAKGYAISHFSQFATQNLNRFKPHNTTKLQAPEIARLRRLYLKKRNMFMRYYYRELSYGDRLFMNNVTPTAFLASSEELATLFHFPGVGVVPNTSIGRVPTKKAAPPSSLPIGE